MEPSYSSVNSYRCGRLSSCSPHALEAFRHQHEAQLVKLAASLDSLLEMAIRPAFQCRTLDGWFPTPVQSESNEDINYIVHVNPWANRSEQHVCECPGYTYRGRCKHQAMAHNAICGWNEIEGPEEASADDIQARRCPRCAGPAHYAMWDDEGE